MKKSILVGITSLFAVMLFAEPVTSSSGNKLGSLGGGVIISVDKDYSKKTPVALKGAKVAEVEYLGEKCIKATKNNQGEIRLAFMFNEPVPAAGLEYIKYSIAGMESYSGHYNIGVMFEEMKGAEHLMACYTSKYAKVNEWSTWTYHLKWDEIWNKNFSYDKRIIGIQFYTNQASEVYLKDVELQK